MQKIKKIEAKDYAAYIAWINTNPEIPPGMTTIDAFYNKTQTRLDNIR